jgi:hypothetical protein
VIQAYIGEPSAITTALGVAAPTTITLWLLVMEILLLRKRPHAQIEDRVDTSS